MATPAEAAGIEFGRQYTVVRITEAGFHCFKVGDVVELINDDGTTEPDFRRVGDGHEQFVPLDDLTEGQQ